MPAESNRNQKKSELGLMKGVCDADRKFCAFVRYKAVRVAAL